MDPPRGGRCNSFGGGCSVLWDIVLTKLNYFECFICGWESVILLKGVVQFCETLFWWNSTILSFICGKRYNSFEGGCSVLWDIVLTKLNYFEFYLWEGLLFFWNRLFFWKGVVQFCETLFWQNSTILSVLSVGGRMLFFWKRLFNLVRHCFDETQLFWVFYLWEGCNSSGGLFSFMRHCFDKTQLFWVFYLWVGECNSFERGCSVLWNIVLTKLNYFECFICG